MKKKMIKNNESMVSIVSPCFNAEKYIARYIESIINQTYKNWELILVDDGSSDDTISVVEQYARNDIRICLIKRDRQPKGANTCRNIGKERAKGEYIIFFDSDDIVSKECLEQRTNFIENNGYLDYAVFRGETLFADSLEPTGQSWGEPTSNDVLGEFLKADYPFGVWNIIYKRKAIEDIFWDEKLAVYQDFDFIVSALHKKLTFKFDTNSKSDYYYIIGHENAITSSFISDEKYCSTKYLFSKIDSIIDNECKCKEYKKDFLKFHLLQFERLIVRGSDSQCNDFYAYISDKYGFFTRIRVRILLLIGIRNKKKGSLDPKAITLLKLLLFYPQILFSLVCYRLKRSKNEHI